MEQSIKDTKTAILEAASCRPNFIYVFFGVLVPLIAVALNLRLDASLDINILYLAGAIFLLPRMAYLYIIIGSQIVTLSLWLLYFRTHGKQYGGFIGGVLLFNAVSYTIFGIASLYKLLFILVWLPPFCAVPVLFLSGRQAIKNARSVLSTPYVIVTFVAGFLFIIILSLVTVKQPWDLIKHLPNARGADLGGMNLSHVVLHGFSCETLEGANLSHADLSYARLAALDMHEVNLYKANLHNSVLEGLNLTNANLREVNLNDAKICQIDFTGADFHGASLGFYAVGRITLKDANLCGADLREIKNIQNNSSMWSGARYDLTTLWPEGFDPVGKGPVLISDTNTSQ